MTPAGNVAETLSRTHSVRFVGRAAELRELESMLDGGRFRLAHLFAPGGVGKTTLLRELVTLARERGVNVALVDGRMSDGSADGFERAVQRAGDFRLLIIDSFEKLRGLDKWLRDVFLPSLSADAIVVTAGRDPLPSEWRTDLAWADALQVIPLRNFSACETSEFLSSRGVPETQHQAILRFTHGHALALALVCESLSQCPGSIFHPEQATDVIHALVDHFTHDISDPARLRALEACAVVRTTTEPVLRALLGTDDVASLFDWLRGLSFMENGIHGLIPHEVVRNAITTDLRWRDSQWHNELRTRAHRYYWELGQTIPEDNDDRRVAVLYDLSFLHSTNTIARQFFEWRSSEPCFADRPTDDDWPAVEAMIERHEGPTACRWARFWRKRQPRATQVFRDRTLEPIGYHAWVEMTRANADDVMEDPATRAAWQIVQSRGPLRGRECALLTRFWVPRDQYQRVSALASQMFLHMVHRYFTTRQLVYSFAYFAQPKFWTPVFSYMGFERISEADYEIDGQTFGVFVLDWRRRPIAEWLDLLMEREMIISPTTPDPAPKQRALVLERDAFACAVKQALRDYTSPEKLARNPLLESRLVRDRAAGKEPVDVLVTLLDAASVALRDEPRALKQYRAVERTYVKPAETQELAAKSLGVPFSTYRRHLTRGVMAIANYLWQIEVGEHEVSRN